MDKKKFTLGTEVDEELKAAIELIIEEEHEKLSDLLPKEKLKSAYNTATYLKNLIRNDIKRRRRIKKRVA